MYPVRVRLLKNPNRINNAISNIISSRFNFKLPLQMKKSQEIQNGLFKLFKEISNNPIKGITIPIYGQVFQGAYMISIPSHRCLAEITKNLPQGSEVSITSFYPPSEFLCKKHTISSFLSHVHSDLKIKALRIECDKKEFTSLIEEHTNLEELVLYSILQEKYTKEEFSHLCSQIAEKNPNIRLISFSSLLKNGYCQKEEMMSEGIKIILDKCIYLTQLRVLDASILTEGLKDKKANIQALTCEIKKGATDSFLTAILPKVASLKTLTILCNPACQAFEYDSYKVNEYFLLSLSKCCPLLEEITLQRPINFTENKEKEALLALKKELPSLRTLSLTINFTIALGNNIKIFTLEDYLKKVFLEVSNYFTIKLFSSGSIRPNPVKIFENGKER